jgi:hypothetical protein
MAADEPGGVPVTEAIIHYVRPEDEGDYDAPYTRIRAVCGAECLLDPEGEPIPADFDFVMAPDPRNLTDCMPCLVRLVEPVAKRTSVPA